MHEAKHPLNTQRFVEKDRNREEMSDGVGEMDGGLRSSAMAGVEMEMEMEEIEREGSLETGGNVEVAVNEEFREKISTLDGSQSSGENSFGGEDGEYGGGQNVGLDHGDVGGAGVGKREKYRDGWADAINIQDGAESEENEESELPVLRGTGEVIDGEESSDERKILRSEIPDSEADTEEAVSPAKGTVEIKIRAPETHEQDAGQEAGSINGSQADDGDQDVETEATAPSTEVEHSPVPSNDQTSQHPEKQAFAVNQVHRDSSAVSFVDYESRIILPRLTTSDLQPTHTQTQTQTQTQEEEVVNSHFADAVAVMSDVGGWTQDVMSSAEESVSKGKGVAMVVSGEVGPETLPTGEREAISKVVMVDEVRSRQTAIPDSERHGTRSSEEDTDAADELASSSQHHAIQDIGGAEQAQAVQHEGNVLNALEGKDTVMSDESQDRQVEATEDFVSPAKEDTPEDIEMQSHTPNVTATITTKTRSIPDSDDDDELPDAEPASKEAEDQVKLQAAASKVSVTSTIKPVESKKRSSHGTSHSSSPKTATTAKIHLPPKTPDTSFKSPTIPTTTSPQPTELLSSPAKPEVTTSTPKKEMIEEEKTPMKSFTASDGSQNKDVLMAELKAIKIASIQARNASLEAEIKKKKARLEEVSKDLKFPAAETVKNHIKLLHDYNDIRDVGQGLVGMIADNRGVRIGELYEEFGVGLKD